MYVYMFALISQETRRICLAPHYAGIVNHFVNISNCAVFLTIISEKTEFKNIFYIK
jgi:hypothetical protein